MKSMFLVISLVVGTHLVAPCSQQEESAKLSQRWIDRTVDTMLAVVSDPNLEDHEKNYIVGIASLALGQIGGTDKVLDLLNKPGFEKDSELRDQFLLGLADGLAAGDHVEDAFRFADMIENENLRGMAYYLTPIRQSQRGDFEDAENLLSRIPQQRHRDRAVAQICSEYLKVNRPEDAQRLCIGLADSEQRSMTEKEIEKHSKQPSIRDDGYVEYKLSEAQKYSSAAAMEFLKPYFQAERALELKDNARFQAESIAAWKLVEKMNSNDGCLIMLARLLYRAGKTDDAKELFVMLFRNYAEADKQFDFNMMLFGSGKPADAQIIAECLTRDEAKLVIERMLKYKSNWLVAAPIFGAVVSQKNPGWAEEIYQSTTDLKLKADLASWCVIFLAEGK